MTDSADNNDRQAATSSLELQKSDNELEEQRFNEATDEAQLGRMLAFRINLCNGWDPEIIEEADLDVRLSVTRNLTVVDGLRT
ncbi:hypothetical protein N0V91_001247 [Didymella pomorum]|uniref:Uncharacterized protein n=1 Tax=Didymella pomorum TaxID=749634 RepID=A0A9W8ZKV8_9PLEO|nr:hypothetical protein N0V91_001247 [Didymella pomorum]